MSEELLKINAFISVMPTNLDAVRKQRERYMKAIADGTIKNLAEESFQGSVSVSDAQTSVTLRFLSNREQLQEMLPPGKNLAIDDPPVVTVSAIYQGGLKWLAGRPYNLVIVALPVVHNGKSGKTYGSFLPVVWENMTEPIITGRELLGWPKIYAELPPPRKFRDTWQCIASWYGFTFLDINVTGIRPPTAAELRQLEEDAARARSRAGLISHKFIVRTGSIDETDADYLTISTDEGAPVPTIREVLIGKADIRFIRGTWEQLPTMVHIVEKLAALEIKEVYDAIIVTQTGGGMGATRILE